MRTIGADFARGKVEPTGMPRGGLFLRQRPSIQGRHTVKLRFSPAFAMGLALAGCLDLAAPPPGAQVPGQVTTLLNMECTGARPRNISPGTLWLPSDGVVPDSVILELTKTSSVTPSCVLLTENLPVPEAPNVIVINRLDDSTYSVVLTGSSPGLVQISVAFNNSRAFTSDVLTASQGFAAAAWGHGGAGARTPPNTLIALRTAIQARLAGSEFDIRLTRDTVPVMIHDATVDRTTLGSGAV
jgi:hypothetical protein